MRKIVFPLLLFFLGLLFLSACHVVEGKTTYSSTSSNNPTQLPVTSTSTILVLPVPSQRSYHPLLLAHYMPWYQTSETSGSWGWHWTMNHFNPDLKDVDGRSEIASHFYPLTGPYDSSDPHILEYQVMLMKLSGIDGVIVDWYGYDDFWDYGSINQATLKLFEQVRKAGLLFAICYEDSTINNMVSNGYLEVGQEITHVQEVMRYLQDHFFNDEAYLKVGDRPVLLVFGNPPYFKTSSAWREILSLLDPTPILITQDKTLSPTATSSYPWPPMTLAQGGELSPTSLDAYLTSFNQLSVFWQYWIAGAFPGFKDIYQQADVGLSHGFLDSLNGLTFSKTLNKAFEGNPDVIQLITWNDYNEGTMIEPTLEYGYIYLGILQNFKRAMIDPAFMIKQTDLSLPLEIFKLRKQFIEDNKVNSDLDRAVNFVFSGELAKAREILAIYNK
jgi:hypothetical protein